MAFGLKKSAAEIAADTSVKVMRKGRASTGETAKILGVSVTTIRMYIAQGKLKAVLLGGKQFIPVSELQKFGAALPPTSVVKDARHLEPLDSNDENNEAYYD